MFDTRWHRKILKFISAMNYIVEHSQVLGDRYSIIDEIGSGSFSVVYKARHLQTGHYVSIKAISLTAESEANIDLEVETLRQVDHPLIIKILDFFRNEKYAYIVNEYFESTTLLKLINKSKHLPEDVGCIIAGQVFMVLKFLHDKKIVHRDVKLENILINKLYQIKLIDFGFARTFQKPGSLFKTICGSTAYSPPEMIMGHPYTISCDMWSFGVIIYALTTGKLPFYSDNVTKIAKMIVKENPIIPKSLSPELQDLLIRLFIKDPRYRINTFDIENHPWMKMFTYSKSYACFSEIESHSLVDLNRLDMSIICNIPNIEKRKLIDDLINKRLNYFTAGYKLARIHEIMKKSVQPVLESQSFQISHTIKKRDLSFSETFQPNEPFLQIAQVRKRNRLKTGFNPSTNEKRHSCEVSPCPRKRIHRLSDQYNIALPQLKKHS